MQLVAWILNPCACQLNRKHPVGCLARGPIREQHPASIYASASLRDRDSTLQRCNKKRWYLSLKWGIDAVKIQMTILSSKAKRELKRDQRRILIDSIEIRLLSPNQIRVWGERQLPNGKRVGQVKNSKTVNYKRFTPLRDGLFCERIFGPVTSFVCACGKRQPRMEIRFCERCEVEYTDQRVRRYRLGFIPLVSPAAHIWYLKGRPSYLSLFLGKRKKSVVALSYCNAYLVEQAASQIEVPPHLAKRQNHGMGLFCNPIKSSTQVHKFSERFEMPSTREASQSQELPGDWRERDQTATIKSKAGDRKNDSKATPPAKQGMSNTLEQRDLRGEKQNRSQVTSFYRFLAEVVANNANKRHLIATEVSTAPNYLLGRSGLKRGNARYQDQDRSRAESKYIQKRDRSIDLSSASAGNPLGGPSSRQGEVLNASLQLFSNIVLSSQQQNSDLYTKKAYQQEGDTLGNGSALSNKRGEFSYTPGLQLLDAYKSRASKKQKSIKTASSGCLHVESMHRRALSASTQSKQAVVKMYNRAQSLPLLPTLICKYNLRDELLNFLDSSPAMGDVPVPIYCQIRRWQPLRDVHKFMSEQPLYQRDDVLPIEDRLGDASRYDERGADPIASFVTNLSNGLTLPTVDSTSIPFSYYSTVLRAASSRLSVSPSLLADVVLPRRGVKRLYSSHRDRDRHKLDKEHNALPKQEQEQIVLSTKRLLYNVYKPPSRGAGWHQVNPSLISSRKRKDKDTTHSRTATGLGTTAQPINGHLPNNSSLFKRDKSYLSPSSKAYENKDKPFSLSSVWQDGHLAEPQDAVLSPFLIIPRIMRSQGIKEVVLNRETDVEHMSQECSDLTLVWANEDYSHKDGKRLSSAFTYTPPIPGGREEKDPVSLPYQEGIRDPLGEGMDMLEEGINNGLKGRQPAPLEGDKLPAESINKMPKRGPIDQRSFVVERNIFANLKDLQTQYENISSNAVLSKQKDVPLSTYTSKHKPPITSQFIREPTTRGEEDDQGNLQGLVEKDATVSVEPTQLGATLVGSGQRGADGSVDRRSIGTPRRTNKKEMNLLSPLEFVTIREILSYTGGGALEKLLKRFNTQLFSTFLSAEVQTARDVYKTRASLLNRRPNRGERRALARLCRRISRHARRLKLSQLLTRNQRRPEWMMISSLPVLPPDLRPILQMSESLVVASDLNNLYQRVIYRNNRYHKLRFIDFHLVTAIQRLVQDAVDRLIENGKGGSQPFYTPGGRPLRSLSDTLKGKRGRFRLNLLGKRVDFSGRSVIVVSPELKIHECGLPKAIALELYHYFLLRGFMIKREAYSIVVAKKLIKQQKPAVWDMLRDIIYHHPLLLNRAPTLHRLGIQAFQPKLVLGNAILLHPLVCSGFNADFDGDQMGVHLPLSFQARAEAWDLLWSRNNLLSPATGQPVLMPSQDMVLGFYYMTQLFTNRSLVPWDALPLKSLSLRTKTFPVIKPAPRMRDVGKESIANTIGYKQAESLRSSSNLKTSSPNLQSQPQLAKKEAQGETSHNREDNTSLRRGKDTSTRNIQQEKHRLSESNHLKSRYTPRPSRWQVPQSSKLFLTQAELIHAFQTRCIDLHTPVWLRCDIPFETDEGASGEAPLELRITSFGGSLHIYPQHKRRKDVKTPLSRVCIRTTAGRVLVNTIIAAKR